MNSPPLIEARDLAVGYSARTVAANINFALHSGEALAVLGPNGAGKTTLFRTLLGLLAPRGGKVLLQSQLITSLTPAQVAQHIAYVPQSSASQFGYSVIEVVEMARAPHLAWYASPGASDRKLAVQALERLGMQSYAERNFAELSGGERQLVLIARALCAGASCLLLDEPTASLDFGNRLRVQEALRQLKAQGISLVFTTHEPQQAIELASESKDRTLSMLRDGSVRIEATNTATQTDALATLYEVPLQSIASAMHR